MKRIAFFDFDGTISKEDTFIKFVKYIVGDNKFNKALILFLPILLLYKIKILSDDYVKKLLTKYFFKGFPQDIFEAKIKEFSKNKLGNFIKDEAMQRISFHKENGDKIVVVSASFEDFLQFWCLENDIELLATKLEKKDAFLSGNFASKNCYGEEKVIRIKQSYNLDNFSYIYAYGDSSGDKDMLDIANESFYKPFE